KGHGELASDSTGETGFSVARGEIEKQNYKVEDLVLLQTPEVPQDASILIIAGPKTDPMESEMESIRAYIKRGGSVLVMLNPFKTPLLAALLKEYGFVTAEDIVVDRMSRAMGGDYLLPVIMTYIQFPITKNFNMASFFPETRSVRVENKTAQGIEAQELAMTSPVSWTINEEQLKSGNANFDEKTGTKGPISVMAVSQVTVPDSKEKAQTEAKEAQETDSKDTGSGGGDQSPQEENVKSAGEPAKPQKARIVVLGSAQVAANKYFKLQGNGDLFMNTISWLAEDENLISIRPKSPKAQPFVLTAREAVIFFLVPVLIMPLAWIVAGIAVYIYRRRMVRAAEG
ncbi:MAG: gliding motility-associatede transport system auxiliary component, partial [Thermodesulfobacteriota bacterium]|nr:gliding motility-associatede transport system auxiliary component [Thermodesulfobacteriota bacterium]